MQRCTVKRGFLHLRECGEPALFKCSVCHQPACSEHLVGEGERGVCVECYARQHPSEGLGGDSVLDASNATRWRHSNRDHFYHETDYRPAVASGAYYASTYGAEDIAAFGQEVSDGGEPWDEDGPDFADS